MALLEDSLFYEMYILLVFVIYAIWLGRILANMVHIKFSPSNPFGQLLAGRGMADSVYMFDKVLDWMLLAGVGTILLSRGVDFVQRYDAGFATFATSIIGVGVWLWLLLAGVFVVGSFIWGAFIIGVMNYFLHSDWMYSELMHLRSSLLKISLEWLPPFILMSALERDSSTMTYIAGFATVGFFAIYIFRSFSLFVGQKISILHWILYLCAVDIFPLSLMWGIFVR